MTALPGNPATSLFRRAAKRSSLSLGYNMSGAFTTARPRGGTC